MPLEMQGLDDLENDLTNMAAALEFGSGVDRALQAGAKPIEEQMLHNASTDPKIITGALHDSIHTGKVKNAGWAAKPLPSAYITLKRARTTQIHWSTATAGLPPRPRIPSSAPPSIPVPRTPMTRSAAPSRMNC